MTRLARVAALGVAAFVLGSAAGPAQAAPPRVEQPRTCAAEGTGSLPVAAGARGRGAGRTLDHREVGAAEQQAIASRTETILRRQGAGAGAERALTGSQVPVYVHVMAAEDGTGDVTDARIREQVAVLDATFAGEESAAAADVGVDFTLAGIDRFYNDAWHQDRLSSKYRAATRRGGADALNIWLVEFGYLGIATFPWDYAQRPQVDGVRVLWSSLPGGTETNYNLGETATHEVGHWLGLFHTFQGGCREPGDEVADTPAQSVATNGCPAGQDSCAAPGLDAVHNYMDYSYDRCYDQFSAGQATRMGRMWAAYRG